MIYTITFNPSIDYILKTDLFIKGAVNRSKEEEFYPGGKGINVSIMLKNLGFDNKALGFVAGFSGDKITAMLNELDCRNDFVKLKCGFSRINVKIFEKNEETEINGRGPLISKEDIDELLSKLNDVTADDFIVLAGSIPKNLPQNIYEIILEKFSDKNAKFIVDTTGKLLLNALKFKPFLIKPNNFELGEIFNKQPDSNEEIIVFAKKLQYMGARNVLVSLAEKGALLIDENENVHFVNAPNGELINSVGSGDSMVAGFVAGYIETLNYEKALKKAVACGSASAFQKWIAKKDDVEKLVGLI